MNNEISEEAKRALADLPRRKALARLEQDGAQSTAAVQRRVRALAQERNIPPADFAKLMHKRITTPAVMAFCKKHKVSFDWLLCGDLQGLQRMTCEAKAQQAETVEAQRQEIVRLFLALPARLQPTALAGIREIAERSRSNG
jgi:hypothetical protein